MRALFAYDGSPFAKRALRYVEHLGPGIEAIVVTVSTTLIEAPRTEQSIDPEQGVAEAHELLQEAAGLAAEHGVEPVLVHATGNPAAEILAQAEAHRVDLILVGQRGQSSVARFLEGSVTDRVVRHANCDVLVVR